MPAWLADLSKALLSASPTTLVVIVVAYLIYRIVRQLLASPLGLATLIGLLAGSERRKDARELVRLLCGRSLAELEAIELPIAPPEVAGSAAPESSGPADIDGCPTAISRPCGDPGG